MSTRQLLALALVLALAPGLWWRTSVPNFDFMPPVEVRPLAVQPGASGPLHLLRGWELRGADPYAGGYSALLWRGGDRLLAASDNGRLIELEGPDFVRAHQRPIFTRDSFDKVGSDIEALAARPGGGPVWAAAEGRNAITRASAALVGEAEVQPPEMAHWKSNTGPETLVRLPGGRFLAISERSRDGFHEGVLFSGDPVETGGSEAIRVQVPTGFRPVDGVAGPDGTVLVLLRQLVWRIPAGFRSAVAVYRTADLSPRTVWRPAAQLALPAAAPPENYEGIALRPEPRGGATLWLISDDNLSGFQRSLLLEFAYRPRNR